FPFVPITADFCNDMRKGVIESHVAGLHERPGLSFQDLIFITCQLFNSTRSLTELLDQLPANAGKLKVAIGSTDTVPRPSKLRCEPMMEMGLVEDSIADRVSHFQGFPFLLDLIKGRIHDKDMN